MRSNFTPIMCALLLCLSFSSVHAAEERWPGVDKTVVERYASEHGRQATPGPINLDGDLSLFAFLVAGAAGGFVMGYYYRDFMAKKRDGGKV